MASGSRPAVPIALGSATTDTEEGRAFYQERLGLFGELTFLIPAGFYVIGATTRFLTGMEVDFSRLPLPSPNLFHLVATLVAGGLWIICRRTTLSAASLRWLDAVTTAVLCACYALMGSGLALYLLLNGEDARHALYIGMLACTYTVIARAIAVPSTAARTAAVSAVGMLPLVGGSALVLQQIDGSPLQATIGSVDVISWSGAAVVTAAVASRVIFGLRAEVSQIRRLGQYTLEEKIGEGGMGVVYRARHAMLRRPTAVKLLPPDKAGEQSIQRFEREVQLTAQLNHPSTVAIFDYGRTPQGVFYYAMEYLEGCNLDELVRIDGPQPPGRVIHIMRQVSGALGEAHRLGLIHRDVKPGNIILTERGGVSDMAKVVDFGLVKDLDPKGIKDTLAVTTGTVIAGTPLYLSPEAIRGEPLDGRSDLYALGAVGYFLLTGKPVFSADTVVEIFAHHLHTAPAPPSVGAGRPIPRDLEAVILACLSKDPAARPSSAARLDAALADCARQTPWPTEAAAAWWTTHRLGATRPAHSERPTAQLETMTVDLHGRQG